MISKALPALLMLIVVLVLVTVGVHRVKTNREIALLQEKGYYNPVSVGDYSLNVAIFGNEKGKHTVVGLAGLGMGDYSVAAKQMTACIEEDNRVVFVDRAGYGFSDDTDREMTLESIVEDYRNALKNAGIAPPYVLMPHSIGGAYANYWSSQYPEEIEGIVFVDGSQLCETAFDSEEPHEIGAYDHMLALLAKLGFGRYVLRAYFYHYPDNYTEEEQTLGDALMLMTLDSLAPVSEDANLAENAQRAFRTLVTNEIPKLYLCASWGMETKEDIIEYNTWVNRQIEINNLDMPLQKLEYEEEALKEILETYENARKETIYPYAEKMGNCAVICLGGDHMIYEQKPEACGKILKDFLDEIGK